MVPANLVFLYDESLLQQALIYIVFTINTLYCTDDIDGVFF